MKLFEKVKIDYKNNHEREIRFLNFPIIQYGKIEENGSVEKYLDIFPKSFEHKELDKILNLLPEEYDYIFLIRAGLGEAYLLNFMLDTIIKKYNLKKPCLICKSKTYVDLFNLFNPNIDSYYNIIDFTRLSHVLQKRCIKYKNITFNINPSTFNEIKQLCANYETNVENRHYTDIIKTFNNIDNFTYKNPIFNSNIEKYIYEKINYLNKDNFIFIINKANFIHNLSYSFWEKLITTLKKYGYDVLTNSPSLSIPEAMYLAAQSKAVIGMRCGFSEILSTLSIPKHIIYTNCKFHDLPNFKDNFSLKKYPFVDKNTIFEYQLFNQNEEELLKKIIRNLCCLEKV